MKRLSTWAVHMAAITKFEQTMHKRVTLIDPTHEEKENVAPHPNFSVMQLKVKELKEQVRLLTQELDKHKALANLKESDTVQQRLLSAHLVNIQNTAAQPINKNTQIMNAPTANSGVTGLRTQNSTVATFSVNTLRPPNGLR